MPMKMRNSFFFFSKGRCWTLNFIFPELWTQTYSSFLENSAAADDFKTAYQKLTLLFLTEKKNKRALLLAVKSLCPHKVGSSGEVYSARWKLMLISDQAWQRLSKKLFGKAGALCLLFDRWFISGILNKSTVWVEKSFHATMCVEKARFFRSNLTMFRPCQMWKYYEWFSEVLWLPRKSLCDLSRALTDETNVANEEPSEARILELELLANLSRQPHSNSTFAQKNARRKKPMRGINKAY